MPKLRLTGDYLELSFNGYRDYMNNSEAVKAIPGYRYDPDTKAWTYPADPSTAERLFVTVKPEVSPEVLSWVKEAKKINSNELVTPMAGDGDPMVPWSHDRAPWQPEKLGKPGEEVPFKGLFPYQRAFVEMAGKQSKVAMLLADDMGLGKCGQSSSAVMEFLLRKSAYASGIDMPVDAFRHASDMIAWAGVDDGPKLVIAPASVKGSWERELKMWLGEDIPLVVVDGAWTQKKRNQAIQEGIDQNAWIVVNWEQIRVKTEKVKKKTKIVHPITREFLRWQEVVKEQTVMREPLFEKTPWVAVIADEAHRAKNRKALQTQGLWRIQAPFKLALTGTPLMNTPDELWAILKWLYPDEFGRSVPPQKKDGQIIRGPIKKVSYWDFYNKYVEYYEGAWGKVVTGVKNPDSLRTELKGRLVRRTKDEVLDLPPKVRSYVPVKLNKGQRKLYEEAEKKMWLEVQHAVQEGDKSAIEFVKQLEAGKNVYQIVNGASRIVRLRQVASTPALLGGEDDSAKLDAMTEIISDAQPKQFVVFSEFKGTCRAAVERLRKLDLKAVTFTGDESSEERSQIERDFQAGDIDVVVGTIGAMKEGITLTAADTVIFLERHWTPAINEQCEDRLHRVGQQDKVTVIILEAEDTVDTSKVSATNAIKHMIVSAVIQKDDVKEIR